MDNSQPINASQAEVEIAVNAFLAARDAGATAEQSLRRGIDAINASRCAQCGGRK